MTEPRGQKRCFESKIKISFIQIQFQLSADSSSAPHHYSASQLRQVVSKLLDRSALESSTRAAASAGVPPTAVPMDEDCGGRTWQNVGQAAASSHEPAAQHSALSMRWFGVKPSAV